MPFWSFIVFTFMLLPLTANATPDMTAPEAYDAVRTGKLRLIDVRTPQEWRQTGIAPGAGRVDMSRGAEHLLQGVLEATKGDRNAPIALICRTGNRTTQVQRFLQQQGFSNVFNVKEGMVGSAAGPGWIRRGLPVESCAAC